MKWIKVKKEKPSLKLKEDQVRYIKRFLFWPRSITHRGRFPKEKKETRWLEFVTIKQQFFYLPGSYYTTMSFGNELLLYNEERGWWSDMEFVDNP